MDKIGRNNQLRADIMLMIVTLAWGLSYVAMAICLEEMTPLVLCAFRFVIGFLLVVALTFPKLKGMTKASVKYGAMIGAVLTIVYITVSYGVKYTSASNAGFVCALTVIITPIMAFFIYHEKPGKKLFVVLVMCMVGIAMMTLNEDLKPALGDILCAITAVAYAVQMLLTEHAVKQEEVNAFHVGVLQLGFTGLFMTILAFIFSEPTLPQSGNTWMIVIFLAVFCTGLSFVVQPIAQQYTSATHVGIIYALEPVFSAIAAFFIAGEILIPRAYAGAALMLAGTFLMELDVEALFKKKSKN